MFEIKVTNLAGELLPVFWATDIPHFGRYNVRLTAKNGFNAAIFFNRGTADNLITGCKLLERLSPIILDDIRYAQTPTTQWVSNPTTIQFPHLQEVRIPDSSQINFWGQTIRINND